MANLALKQQSLSLKDTMSTILACPGKTRHCAIHESIGGCKRNDVSRVAWHQRKEGRRQEGLINNTARKYNAVTNN
jgi:hypothetical protein